MCGVTRLKAWVVCDLDGRYIDDTDKLNEALFMAIAEDGTYESREEYNERKAEEAVKGSSKVA